MNEIEIDFPPNVTGFYFKIEKNTEWNAQQEKM